MSSNRYESFADPVCTVEPDGDQLVALLDRHSTAADPSSRSVHIAALADIVSLRGRYRAAALHAVETGSDTLFAAATERLLADVYDTVSSRLLPVVEGYPRIALDLRDDLTRSLPIETAHRDTEPALFETTQLYRLAPGAGPWIPARPPRRFVLTFRDAELVDLDMIALEQNLIRSVSTTGVCPDRSAPPEPLIHVTGHDPTIPDDIVEPDRRAHVVLSGCRSLPPSLPPGVASAVGSLWDVDDHSSSSIMAAYHGRLALGISPVEALRQAQLLHRHLPTGAWASYVHIGAPI
jgi:hypothetical protein